MEILVPKRSLRKTPSRRDGVSAETEEMLRIFGVELIQRATVLLRLRQVTCVGAAAIFQRFYFRRSFADVDCRVVAAAALHLACKLEETHRRIRDVVVVFHRLRLRQASASGLGRSYDGIPTPLLEVGSRDYIELKQEVIATERLILRELGFAVGLLLEHPHKYVIQFVKSVVRSPDWLVGELAQAAWSYLNDSMRTVLSCMYEPHQLATAGIYLAARARKVKLPQNPPWWELFDTSLADLHLIARAILRLYTLPPARYIAVPARHDPKNAALLVEPPTPLCTPGPLRSPSDDERARPQSESGREPMKQADAVEEVATVATMVNGTELPQGDDSESVDFIFRAGAPFTIQLESALAKAGIDPDDVASLEFQLALSTGEVLRIEMQELKKRLLDQDKLDLQDASMVKAKFKIKAPAKQGDADATSGEVAMHARASLQVNCPGKHGLRQYTTEEDGYGCDRCSETFSQGTVLYSCRPCGYDLCNACYSGCAKDQGNAVLSDPYSVAEDGEVLQRNISTARIDESLLDLGRIDEMLSEEQTRHAGSQSRSRSPRRSQRTEVGVDAKAEAGCRGLGDAKFGNESDVEAETP